MFCIEELGHMSAKMREIVTRPVPMWNVSCFNEEVWETKIHNVTLEAVLKSSVLFILAFATITVNLFFVLILRSNKYQRHVHVQSRYFLIAMSYNCILNGCATMMFSVYPGIMDCWPYGEIVCEAQVSQYYTFMVG
jgi:hypothetical protein